MHIQSFLLLLKNERRILLNAESPLSALCHKTELKARTQQKFTLLLPPTPEKQGICPASASCRKTIKC